jgi:hypothetical protein
VFAMLEKQRGRIPRSRFVADMLERKRNDYFESRQG